jgi:hypothetical protein
MEPHVEDLLRQMIKGPLGGMTYMLLPSITSRIRCDTELKKEYIRLKKEMGIEKGYYEQFDSFVK